MCQVLLFEGKMCQNFGVEVKILSLKVKIGKKIIALFVIVPSPRFQEFFCLSLGLWDLDNTNFNSFP